MHPRPRRDLEGDCETVSRRYGRVARVRLELEMLGGRLRSGNIASRRSLYADPCHDARRGVPLDVEILEKSRFDPGVAIENERARERDAGLAGVGAGD